MNGNPSFYPNGQYPPQQPPQQPQYPPPQPQGGQQIYQQPPYQQPGYAQPQAPQQPAYQQPAYSQPQYQPQQPAYQQPYAQPQYPQQPVYRQANAYNGAPGGYRVPLKTNKSLIKYILLSIITFGIYSLVCMSSVGTSVNTVASRYDGKKTMHFCLLSFIVAPLTLGIGALVWYHRVSDRICGELTRRGIPYSFGSTDFWLWCILGSLLFGIGPLVYMHKLFKATNYICESYNMYG